jgi:hypothetical protein
MLFLLPVAATLGTALVTLVGWMVFDHRKRAEKDRQESELEVVTSKSGKSLTTWPFIESILGSSIDASQVHPISRKNTLRFQYLRRLPEPSEPSRDLQQDFTYPIGCTIFALRQSVSDAVMSNSNTSITSYNTFSVNIDVGIQLDFIAHLGFDVEHERTRYSSDEAEQHHDHQFVLHHNYDLRVNETERPNLNEHVNGCPLEEMFSRKPKMLDPLFYKLIHQIIMHYDWYRHATLGTHDKIPTPQRSRTSSQAPSIAASRPASPSASSSSSIPATSAAMPNPSPTSSPRYSHRRNDSIEARQPVTAAQWKEALDILLKTLFQDIGTHVCTGVKLGSKQNVQSSFSRRDSSASSDQRTSLGAGAGSHAVALHTSLSRGTGSSSRAAHQDVSSHEATLGDLASNRCREAQIIGVYYTPIEDFFSTSVDIHNSFQSLRSYVHNQALDHMAPMKGGELRLTRESIVGLEFDESCGLPQSWLDPFFERALREIGQEIKQAVKNYRWIERHHLKRICEEICRPAEIQSSTSESPLDREHLVLLLNDLHIDTHFYAGHRSTDHLQRGSHKEKKTEPGFTFKVRVAQDLRVSDYWIRFVCHYGGQRGSLQEKITLQQKKEGKDLKRRKGKGAQSNSM